MDAEEQRFDFVRLVLQEGLDLRQVWAEYAALSGRSSENDLVVYAVGGIMLPRRDRDLIALAARHVLSRDHHKRSQTVTEITHALTQHPHQNAENTQDAPALVDAPGLMDAVLNLRAGASMVGAQRLHLLLTRALTDIRTGCIVPKLLLQELRHEARWFKAAAAHLHHPSPQFAA